MGRWNSKRISDAAKADFEKVWLETKELVKGRAAGKAVGRGSSHPIYDAVFALRGAYLDMGFEEIVNPFFIDEGDVKKQFGPEAVAVLDRCYYLGGLPRPDIGLSDDKLVELQARGVSADKEALQGVLRHYKTGEIGGDDLIYQLSKALGVDDIATSKILEDLFPEFKALRPAATSLTLRSHMTSGWFLTLHELIGKRPLPIRLFSIDRCFRREQREDANHLRTYHSASCVVADPEAGVEDGKEVAKGLLSRFGFEKFKFKLDEKRSKYYAPDTQTEVYAYNPKTDWVEVATFGMYSPVALSSYGIEYPVMNLGLGVERLVMVLQGYSDIRELAYPQFRAEFELSDAEIARMITVEKAPASDEGKAIARSIVETGVKNATAKGPCAFVAHHGAILGKKVEVKISEEEAGQNLLGPAALNEVYVYEGNVYGVSKAKGPSEVMEKGVATGITYLKAFADLAAWRIEEAVKANSEEAIVKVKGVKMPSDINLRITEPAMRYITGKNKRIDIRGPVFVAVSARIG